MLKKVITLMICCCVLISSTYSYAYSKDSTLLTEKERFPKTMNGYLYGDEGKKVLIKGTLTEVKQEPYTVLKQNNSSPEFSATYEYDITGKALAAAATSHSDEVSGTDDSAYAKVFLTLHYKTRKTPTEYLLTKVSGRWVDPDKNDGTKIRAKNKLFAVCRGPGPDSLWKNQTKNATVSNNFSTSTNFTDYICGHYGAMGATLTIKLSQGSQRSWDFTLENFRFP